MRPVTTRQLRPFPCTISIQRALGSCGKVLRAVLHRLCCLARLHHRHHQDGVQHVGEVCGANADLVSSVHLGGMCQQRCGAGGGTVLNEETVRLEGWFSARGEWTLFSTFDFERYNPYVKESDKCVSLINATGSQRSEYEDLPGLARRAGYRAGGGAWTMA